LVAIHGGVTYLLSHIQFDSESPQFDSELRLLLVVFWVAAVTVYYFSFVVVPRLRHLGASALAVLWCFVPILNLLILGVLFLYPEGDWQKFRGQI